jgi:hypothetical protein
MAPELAQKFPNIRTYAGQGVSDPSASVRFDLTAQGFRAQIMSAKGTSYIDPSNAGLGEAAPTGAYAVYARNAYERNHNEPGHVCEWKPESEDELGLGGATPAPRPSPSRISSGESLRTFRLALAATGEYSAAQGGTVPLALSAMVSTMNRVNGIYEREISARMVLVANTDRLIYTNADTDPYTNGNGSTLLGENQANVNTIIGEANYDIGHVFSTGGGGVASLGSLCATGRKAAGVTGQNNPIGDAFDVDFVAHEMGHQFNGPHTFNSSTGSCAGGNRSAGSAYETGSGVSIMAYAGICGAEDLQPNSEDYFHRASLNSILNFVATACGVATPTGNTPPIVIAPPNVTVPKLTPFTLTASGSDVNNDSLTYLWEQFDLGTATSGGVQLTDVGNRPLFRPMDPIASPSRTFPDMRFVLNNANVPPASAPLPGGTTAFYTGEAMASTARVLNFRVTARDNRVNGGGTNEASVAVTVDANSGPFVLTAPNTSAALAGGSTQTVTWNVAGTDQAPVNSAFVNILLSIDGGLSFTLPLGFSLPNNGSASVTLPSVVTNKARVKIESADNIFFDVSDVDFAISVAGNTAPSITASGALSTTQGAPLISGVVANVSDTQDPAGALQISASGAPPELAVSVTNNAGAITLNAAASCSLVAPTSGAKPYPVVLTVTDAQGARNVTSVNVNVGTNVRPTIGSYVGQIMSLASTASFSPSAPPQDGNNNLVGMLVAPSSLPGGGTVTVAANGVVTVTTTATTTFGTYTIRASANDACGGQRTAQFNVSVLPAAATLSLLSQTVNTSGAPNVLIEPNECNTLSLSLGNGGAATAGSISSVLSTTTPGVTITQARSGYQSIPALTNAANITAYEVSTAPTVACFSTIALRQTVTYAGTTTPSVFDFTLPVGRPAGQAYAYTTSTGASISPGGSLVAGSNVDDAVFPFTVPADFNFSVFNTPIAGGSTITLSTNGNVQFAPTGTNAYTNLNLPVLESPGQGVTGTFPASAPTIFAYWNDIDLVGTGGIFTELSGTAPNRVLKIEWRGIDLEVSNAAVKVALLLREGSNVFDVVYQNAAIANGTSTTIGAQANSTGPNFSVFGFNQAGLLVPGTKITAAFPAAICSPGPGVCFVDPNILFKDGFE